MHKPEGTTVSPVRQKKTRTWLVTAADKSMSGWGEARSGLSKCAWAYETYEQAKVGFDWVSNRSEMKYVNIVQGNWYHRNAAHVSIYVADIEHPSLAEYRKK